MVVIEFHEESDTLNYVFANIIRDLGEKIKMTSDADYSFKVNIPTFFRIDPEFLRIELGTNDTDDSFTIMSDNFDYWADKNILDEEYNKKKALLYTISNAFSNSIKCNPDFNKVIAPEALNKIKDTLDQIIEESLKNV